MCLFFIYNAFSSDIFVRIDAKTRFNPAPNGLLSLTDSTRNTQKAQNAQNVQQPDAATCDFSKNRDSAVPP